MIEVAPKLFVGGGEDFESIRGEPEWKILQCAKEPWHREALGYTGRGAPKNDKEYLWAYRGNRLILNMVDAPQFMFFNPAMIEEGLTFISDAHHHGKKVLVHCNQGNSRAPGMALLYMRRRGLIDLNYEYALAYFESVYPNYAPGKGMDDYVKREFAEIELRHETPPQLGVAS